MQDGIPFGPPCYGKPPDVDIAQVAAAHGKTVQLLYTSPPPRKPLTDEQIMANEVLRYHFALNGGEGPISKQGRKIIDAIEAAHGIKGQE
jgi:hypothetical protein